MSTDLAGASSERPETFGDGSNSSSSSFLIKHPYLQLSNDGKQFQLYLMDVRHTLDRMATENNPGKRTREEVACKFANKPGSTLRVSYSNGALQLECDNSDLAVDLVQSLMIDRLHLQQQVEASADNKQEQRAEFRLDIRPVLSELDTLSQQLRQMEESEKRIQSELYEAADYTKALMDQLAIANELNEL